MKGELVIHITLPKLFSLKLKGESSTIGIFLSAFSWYLFSGSIGLSNTLVCFSPLLKLVILDFLIYMQPLALTAKQFISLWILLATIIILIIRWVMMNGNKATLTIRMLKMALLHNLTDNAETSSAACYIWSALLVWFT